MSTVITNYNTKNYLVQEYIAEWEVDNLSLLGTKSIRTPIFSPVPNADIKLCFELGYQIIKMAKKEREVSCFKLVLLKVSKTDMTPSLKLKMDVTVNYSDGSVYQAYSSPASISVENIDSVTCADVISECYTYMHAGRYEKTTHKNRMSSDKLIIKFHTKFYGHLCFPNEYYQNMDHLNNLQSFVRDFKTIYDLKTFSDVEFVVGKKKLPAHKTVLAAHSPVFMKMLEHDFVESKTNTITITDYDEEIFQNFLKYLYCGEIENKSWPLIKDLYTLSDKYVVQSLKQDCGDVIASIIELSNVCDILEMAYFYDDKKLKGQAISFAVQHFKDLASTESWETVISNNPLIGYEILRAQSSTL